MGVTQPSGPRGRGLAPIYAAGFVTAFAAHAVAANLGGYSLRHHTSLWQLGVLLAVYDLAEIVLKPVFGSLSDRIGPKPVMIAGLVAFSPAAGAALAALGGRKRSGRLFGGYGGAKTSDTWRVRSSAACSCRPAAMPCCSPRSRCWPRSPLARH